MKLKTVNAEILDISGALHKFENVRISLMGTSNVLSIRELNGDLITFTLSNLIYYKVWNCEQEEVEETCGH